MQPIYSILLFVHVLFGISLHVQAQEKEDLIFINYGQDPEFPGGRKAMMQFLKENIKYPPLACIDGRVSLRFVIDHEGNIDHSSIQVLRGMPNCPECDQEAIRLVKLMPQWKPAKEGGKTVKSEFHLPIKF